MQTRVFPFFLFLIFQLLFLSGIGQNVIINDIPCDSVKIDQGINEQLVDSEIFPELIKHLHKESKVILAEVDTSWWGPDIIEMIEAWKNNNGINDDGDIGEFWTLYKNEKGILRLEKVPFKSRYLFGEIGGGYEIYKVFVANDQTLQKKLFPERKNEDIVLFDEEELSKPLMAIFDNSFDFYEKEIDVINLTKNLPNHKSVTYLFGKNITPKNKALEFDFKNKHFGITYNADLSPDGFSYGGVGTSYDQYYNISVELKDFSTGEKQLIYKIPYDGEYVVNGIYVLNLNEDRFPDVMITVTSELGMYRLLYLSEKLNNSFKLNFIDAFEVWSIDP